MNENGNCVWFEGMVLKSGIISGKLIPSPIPPAIMAAFGLLSGISMSMG